MRYESVKANGTWRAWPIAVPPSEKLKASGFQSPASGNRSGVFHFPLEIIFIRSYLASMKIIIEKHPDGYVAYPAGIQGVVVGEGDTFDEALHDVQSAIRFHIKTFGRESLELENPAVDAFVAEAVV